MHRTIRAKLLTSFERRTSSWKDGVAGISTQAKALEYELVGRGLENIPDCLERLESAPAGIYTFAFYALVSNGQFELKLTVNQERIRTAN